MKRLWIIAGGFAIGVAAMLGILKPWKRTRLRDAPPPPITAPAPPPPAERTPAQEHALQALTALKAGNLPVAQANLSKAASLDPDLFEIPLYQGHIEMLAGDHRAARRSYNEALKRRPGDAKALAGRAAAGFELKEYAGAIEDATAAIATEPDALFTRAAAYGALDRNQESVRDWTAYLALKPKDAHAWMNRGNAHERSGRMSAAVADWRQAVLLDPNLGNRLNPLILEAEK
jgi:tetratricopeptide (TPR) repeat protein